MTLLPRTEAVAELRAYGYDDLADELKYRFDHPAEPYPQLRRLNLSSDVKKRYVYLRVVESMKKDGSEECHVYDQDGNVLGILPANKVTAIVDYQGHPVIAIEIVGRKVELETWRPIR